MKFVSGGPDRLRQPIRRFDMQQSYEHPVEEIERLQRCISDMVQVAPSQTLMPPPQEICVMLKKSFGADTANWPPLVRLPIGDGAISIVPIPLGLKAEIGIVAAGSRRPDFPGQTERLLLRVASNQALMRLQEVRLLAATG